MSLVERVEGGNTIYLKIVEGSLRQEVAEGTDGAKTREWEANGNSGVKHEIIYKNLTGIISQVKIEEVSFGDGKSVEMLKVTVENDGSKAQFSTQSKSRYAIDFMKKLPNLDPTKEVTINPYDFTDKAGIRRTALNIIQDGEKIYSAYWDAEKKKVLKGAPSVSKKDSEGYDSDDWKMHFMKEKKFLCEKTREIAPNFISVSAETVPAKDEEEDDLPF